MLSPDIFLATLVYAAMGIVIFVLSFVLVDKLTPGNLWREIIERKNMAVALLAGAVAIGISSIIAAAIHG
jgi:putative membrane protein